MEGLSASCIAYQSAARPERGKLVGGVWSGLCLSCTESPYRDIRSQYSYRSLWSGALYQSRSPVSRSCIERWRSKSRYDFDSRDSCWWMGSGDHNTRHICYIWCNGRMSQTWLLHNKNKSCPSEDQCPKQSQQAWCSHKQASDILAAKPLIEWTVEGRLPARLDQLPSWFSALHS